MEEYFYLYHSLSLKMFYSIIPWALLIAAVTGLRDLKRQTGPIPPGTLSGCTYFYTSVTGDTCASIASSWWITLQQFITYNPSVKSDCSGLIVGDSYCVEENYGKGPASTSTPPAAATTTAATSTVTRAAGPSPTQTGITSQCTGLRRGRRLIANSD